MAKPEQSSIDSLLSLCRSGRLADAEVQARRLLGHFPDDLALNEIMADILAGQDKYQEAIPAYHKTIEIKPDHADAYFALGNIFLYLGRPDDAIGHYRKVLEIRPGFAAAHSNLGAAMLAHGHGGEAIENLKKALQLDPDLADAHTNLGIALKNEGKTEEAAECFLKALELDPGLAETRNNLGAAMEDLQRLDEAIGNYRQAISIMPRYAEAHCNLGNALAKTGDHLKATESYSQAIDIRPDFAEAHNSLGVSLKELTRFDEAKSAMERAIAVKPDFPQAHNNLATVLRRQGALQESAASARTALTHDPRFAEAFYNLGLALQLDEQREAAVANYQKALDIQPDFADAHSTIGQALQDLGRFDEAITHFEAAGDRMSKARALECLFALGRAEDYKKRLEELCASDPTNIWAAGISAFAAHQWRMENPYSFCRDPLDFISISNVKSQFGSFDDFSASLIKEIKTAQTVWEPPQNTTVNGYHTLGNLFQMGTPRIVDLQRIISRQIEAYQKDFAGRPDGIIAQWPKRRGLFGWHIRLLKDGYQEAHIHPSGWLSGVIYLKLPKSLEGGEGSITFTLHGRDYPILDEDIPTFRHSPREGDIVLFPSSLYHFTSPFHSDGERHVVAFDLCPADEPTEEAALAISVTS